MCISSLATLNIPCQSDTFCQMWVRLHFHRMNSKLYDSQCFIHDGECSFAIVVLSSLTKLGINFARTRAIASILRMIEFHAVKTKTDSFQLIFAVEHMMSLAIGTMTTMVMLSFASHNEECFPCNCQPPFRWCQHVFSIRNQYLCKHLSISSAQLGREEMQMNMFGQTIHYPQKQKKKLSFMVDFVFLYSYSLAFSTTHVYTADFCFIFFIAYSTSLTRSTSRLAYRKIVQLISSFICSQW